MPLIRPFFSGVQHTPGEIYLRTMIGAVEMLKSGTTAGLRAMGRPGKVRRPGKLVTEELRRLP